MLNQTVIVGRLTSDPLTNETEGRKEAYITLAVPRSYKNNEGVYETDFIPCILYNGVAETTSEYCKKGDLVGVKGRLENLYEENTCKLSLIAEKVTFLSATKPNC